MTAPSLSKVAAGVKRHYELGPSASEGWAACAAKTARERNTPNTSGFPADWGTVGHQLGENSLNGLPRTSASYGVVIDHEVVFVDEDCIPPDAVHIIPIDDEMWEVVESYVDLVRSIPGAQFYEQRVPIDHITGEEGGSGTADAVVINGTHVTVIDLKTGLGEKVSASVVIEEIDAQTGEITKVERPNFQLALYGAGALKKFDLFGPFETITLIIAQHRQHHVSEFTLTVAELNGWMDYLRRQAEKTRAANPVATPGKKQCQWCRVRSACPELTQMSYQAAIKDFPDLSDPQTAPVPLDAGKALKLVPLIRAWCDAVEDKVSTDLAAGVPYDDWKLVTGKKGHRYWDDAPKAIEVLKSAGVNPYKAAPVISPADADKALKKTQPEVWETLAPFIKQPKGSPTMVEATDPRPAISNADCFPSF